jgi:predicted ATPase
MMRLDCSKIGVFSRQGELNELKSLIQLGAARGIFIEAAPGVGKSVLLDEFCKATPHIARGKFEQRDAASEPFATLIQIVNDWVTDFSQDASSRRKWNDRIKEYVGKDLSILNTVLPSLRNFLLQEETSSEMQDFIPLSFDDTCGRMVEEEFQYERFRIAFRALIRCVCQHRTLVFVLDDIHCFDPDSIGIIRTLLLDPVNVGKFFVVAASRPLVQYPHIQKLLEDVPQIRKMKLPEFSFKDTSLILNSLVGTIQDEKQLDAGTAKAHFLR